LRERKSELWGKKSEFSDKISQLLEKKSQNCGEKVKCFEIKKKESQLPFIILISSVAETSSQKHEQDMFWTDLYTHTHTHTQRMKKACE